MRAVFITVALALSSTSFAQSPWDIAKKVSGDAAVSGVEKEVNKRLLAESRKNQCSFKTDSTELMAGCDQKLKTLADALIRAKKQLNDAGLKNFKFEVSGHTDSTGNPQHNKELSARRAAVIAKEMVGRGVPESEIISVGMGSDRLAVKPDNTPQKRAKNRRYEIQVRL